LNSSSYSVLKENLKKRERERERERNKRIIFLKRSMTYGSSTMDENNC